MDKYSTYWCEVLPHYVHHGCHLLFRNVIFQEHILDMLTWTRASASPSTSSPNTSSVRKSAAATSATPAPSRQKRRAQGPGWPSSRPQGKGPMSFVSDYCTHFLLTWHQLNWSWFLCHIYHVVYIIFWCMFQVFDDMFVKICFIGWIMPLKPFNI